MLFWFDLIKSGSGRLLMVGVMLFALLSILLLDLFWIQMVQGNVLEETRNRQSVRQVRLPAARGTIYDRNGEVLADVRPAFDLVVYLGEFRDQFRKEFKEKKKEFLTQLKQKDRKLTDKETEKLNLASRGHVIRKVLRKAGPLLEASYAVTDEEVTKHYVNQPSLPFTLAGNLNRAMLASFCERSGNVPGVDLQVRGVRNYPHGKLAAHILGYVGRETRPPDLNQEIRYYYFLPDIIGREGIEAAFDRELRGTAGGKSIVVDAMGHKRRELNVDLPVPGKDVYLTLDRRYQEIMERAMQGHVGAAVLMDPRNGDILAMASEPSFDPNYFINGIDAVLWRELADDPRKPLYHRAIAAGYAPGSVFKLVVALAGLRKGSINEQSVVKPMRNYPVGNRLFGDPQAEATPNMLVDMRTALKVSSNTFFYHYGILTGPDAILDMCNAFFLGERTDIPLFAQRRRADDDAFELVSQERAGSLPKIARRKGFNWGDGDTANLSIGQGELAVTPLQMACMTAAIANGGKLFWPRLVDRIARSSPSTDRPSEVEVVKVKLRDPPVLPVSVAHLDMVRAAMLACVQEDGGTGRRARVEGLSIAGKTGTAQYEKRENGVKVGIGHRAWFVSFAPYDHPRFAMAIVIEEGEAGGRIAAPVAEQIYSGILALESTPGSLPAQPVKVAVQGGGA